MKRMRYNIRWRSAVIWIMVMLLTTGQIPYSVWGENMETTDIPEAAVTFENSAEMLTTEVNLEEIQQIPEAERAADFEEITELPAAEVAVDSEDITELPAAEVAADSEEITELPAAETEANIEEIAEATAETEAIIEEIAEATAALEPEMVFEESAEASPTETKENFEEVTEAVFGSDEERTAADITEGMEMVSGENEKPAVAEESEAEETKAKEIEETEIAEESEEEITFESEAVDSEEIDSEEIDSEEIETEEIETEEIETEEEIPEDDIEYLLSRGASFQNLGDVTHPLAITSCHIVGDQVEIQAKVNYSFTTWDKKLYLFDASMYAAGIDGTEPIAETIFDENLDFSVPLNDNTAESMLYRKFYVGVKYRNGQYVPISEASFITNPEALAVNTQPYPEAKNKKGILVETAWGSDIDELGLSYANYNIWLYELFESQDIAYTYNGKTWYFSQNYIDSMDSWLLAMQKNHVIVTGIILAAPVMNNKLFGYPGANPNIGAFHGWNVVTDEGIECIAATLHFLAERYCRTDNKYGHISGWIVSNEVNADCAWNYTGHQPVEQYAYIYANMMRITYQAVKSVCAHARVYVSLDMFWNNSASSTRYDGKAIIDLLNAYLKAEGDIPWGVAFHPYANPLTEPEFWNDHAENSENAPFISMQNISVLTNYMQKPGYRDPDGSVKHIILSEQGYTSWSNNQGDVSQKQAAALAYAYYITEANPYIDAYIAMRELDAEVECRDGLFQGFWYQWEYALYAAKPAWYVWKYIDTNLSFQYSDPLAPLTGLSSFSSVYGEMMKPRLRSITQGNGGYAEEVSEPEEMPFNWYGEYTLTSFDNSNGVVTAVTRDNNRHAYGGIAMNGSFDFSEKSLFVFDFKGTATNAGENPRVMIRFTSGTSIYEALTYVVSGEAKTLYADLSSWPHKGSVDKIQIWVQHDGIDTYTVTNVRKAKSVQAGTSPFITVDSAEGVNLTPAGFDVIAQISSVNGISRVEFQAWHVRTGATTSRVIKDGTISNTTAVCHFDTSSFGYKTGAYGVKIVAFDAYGIQSVEKIISFTVKGTAEQLVISNVYVTNTSMNGFSCVVEAASGYGLSGNSVLYVWSSTNGQDDMIAYPLNFVNGTAIVNVSVSSHHGNSGEYNCHAYVRDNAGNLKMFAAIADIPNSLPKIISAKVTDINAESYTVSCTFDCPGGVSQVLMPSWSEKNGQDDLIWHQASVSGNTASCTINIRDHNYDAGLYFTHIYVFSVWGGQAVRGVDFYVPQHMTLRYIDGSWYYYVSGQPDMTHTGLCYYNGNWYFVRNGIVDWSYTGLCYYGDSWYYIKNGSVDWSYTGLMYYSVNDTWYYIRNGQIDWNFTDLVYYNGTWYYVKRGQIDWNYSNLVYYNGTWYYVKRGQIDWNYSNLVYYNGTWYYVKRGQIDWNYSNLVYYNGTWYYVKKGQIDWDYSDLVYYNETWYYVKRGQIDWDYSNLVYYNGTWYYVKRSQIDWNYSSLVYYNENWYYVKNGWLDWGFSGPVQYNDEWYYVKNGWLDWNYSGKVEDAQTGEELTVVNGVVKGMQKNP